MRLQGKHILLGVTGSIAAYKAATLVRLLVKEGAEVKVVMTPLAKAFITPLTLATLSKNPILVDFYNPENGDWNNHVSLGLWSDVYLIAPATANTIAKMASGIADNLLLTCYLSARCKVFTAPAMDLDMYNHVATRRNISTLQQCGVEIIEPASGELASGLDGKGRMEEPENIVNALSEYFVTRQESSPLCGKNILVTAGPTYEKIDPVRFIGNHSSGKMGFAIAEELADRGANVFLVSGPVDIKTVNPAITRYDVTSASEMFSKCTGLFKTMNGAVMSAAVADYTPDEVSAQKIKRKGECTIKLKPTEDIAAALGKQKAAGQVIAGFALETENEDSNALKKLESKNLDFIVLNSLNDTGAGFRFDTNRITILDSSGTSVKYPLKKKTEVAIDIVNKLSEYFRL